MIIASLLAITFSADAITITEPDHVITATPGIVHVEPHVAAASSRRLIGVITTTPDQSDWKCSALASSDDGRTWRRARLPVDRCIDPWAVIGDDGTMVIAAIAIRHEGEGDQRFELLTFRSTDEGRNWSEATSLGKAYEHPIIVRDRGALLLTARVTRDDGAYALVVERSEDALATTEPFFAAAPGSVDGQRFIATGLAAAGERLIAGYSASSRTGVLILDGNRGKVIADEPFVGGCGEGSGTFGGYPTLVVHGALFAHVCHGPGYAGMHLSIRGEEGWKTIRVDAAPADSEIRLPMVAINHDGVIAMAWNQRSERDHQGCQFLYASVSTDGGKSVSKPVQLSTNRSCPHKEINGSAGARSWNSGGDYSSLVALEDGSFYVVWADARGETTMQLRGATFRGAHRY